MNSILITGCNRGIGLGLVKCLTKLPKPPLHIFATCRDVDRAVELKELSRQHTNVHIIQIDLLAYDSYGTIAEAISPPLGESGLNLLINNAGVAPKSTRIDMTNENDLIRTINTNTVAPITLAKTLLPFLRQASKNNAQKPLGVQRAAIVNISSLLGSIEANVEGGLYAYRTSKAALNAATKSLSIDLKKDGILCVSMHPGWVKTEMGGSRAPLDVDTSCNSMIKTILNFDKSHNGGFYQYDGEKLPW